MSEKEIKAMRASELAMPIRINQSVPLTEVEVIEDPKRYAFWMHFTSVLKEMGSILRRGIYGGLVLTVAVVTVGGIVQGGALAFESLKGSGVSDRIVTIPWREVPQPAHVSVKPVKSADILREERRYQVDMARESNRTLNTVLSSVNRIASQVRR
ncbi:MAG: hypothetical protein COW12_01705 [Candidatus Omnitrophica bacterium CG12_big_fil_rev_8_21_14_0_65_45_16]|nr:MAG: hypothetical protein COV36_01385 [Alphaproteobacteria bacterium CG11_big_fil_rev_8_21_14_0_20_44_7]PIW65474.1 MAG: hypothetical protein COW12_01705 [Candidatus Omnitrophica bacterium CG12_big_fil_rev_8_21_14_0_65_45_16]